MSLQFITHGSDFILVFGKLPFSLHSGKCFIHFGKKITKIHKIGKIKSIFGLGMTPLLGGKKIQIKSLHGYIRLDQNMNTLILTHALKN